MHSDPVADMLTRLRNGSGARKASVRMPFSKLKLHIAELLKREGYVQDCSVLSGHKPHAQQLEVTLKYDERREPVLSMVKRWSTPGLRVYFKHTEIPKVKNGLGVLLLTTSRGLMTDAEARKAGIGGEALCSVW